jgi:hypothetical protein
VVDLFVIDACLLAVAGELLAVPERLLEHGQALFLGELPGAWCYRACVSPRG